MVDRDAGAGSAPTWEAQRDVTRRARRARSPRGDAPRGCGSTGTASSAPTWDAHGRWLDARVDSAPTWDAQRDGSTLASTRPHVGRAATSATRRAPSGIREAYDALPGAARRTKGLGPTRDANAQRSGVGWVTTRDRFPGRVDRAPVGRGDGTDAHRDTVVHRRAANPARAASARARSLPNTRATDRGRHVVAVRAQPASPARVRAFPARRQCLRPIRCPMATLQGNQSDPLWRATTRAACRSLGPPPSDRQGHAPVDKLAQQLVLVARSGQDTRAPDRPRATI